MNAHRLTWLRWLPRVLALVFALFLSLFALDVFNEHRGILATLIEFLVHLVPAWLVLAALAVAWRREARGGSLFLALAAFYVVLVAHRPLSWSLVIAGPAMLIGLLFLLSAWFRNHLARVT